MSDNEKNGESRSREGKEDSPRGDDGEKDGRVGEGEISARGPESSDQKRAEAEEEETVRRMGGDLDDSGPWEDEEGDEERGLGDFPEPRKGFSSQGKNVGGSLVAVVCVGASAGGLAVLEELFSKMPVPSGLAFVVVSHTDPERVSVLPQLLQNHTSMEVLRVVEGMEIQPDKVYLPPSNKDLSVERGKLHLKEPVKSDGLRLPIDGFLRSLSKDYGESAACIIVSGTGSDGTQGLKAVKEKGGMVMVQSEETAEYAGMPRSAISTGMVDYVLSPWEMPEMLLEYYSRAGSVKIKEQEEGKAPSTMQKILFVLRNRTGHDFTAYKKNTLVRRIERRMNVNRCDAAAQYLDFLHKNLQETEALFQELLIGVTSFFRDPEAFEFLEKEILQEELSRLAYDEPYRVWVPGCATGEEAYSVCMVLQESMDALSVRRDLQIFGTDIDGRAIEVAREGVYPLNIAADVSAMRLRRFFLKEGSAYRVRKDLREHVVFAVQNVLKDPPFSKLNLLVCRNLLIYLKASAQKKLLPLFHYTLLPEGVLFLGSSETIGDFGRLFEPLNKKWNLYRKKKTSDAHAPVVEFPTGAGRSFGPIRGGLARDMEGRRTPMPDMGRKMDRMLLDKYTPTCLVVDRGGEIHYIHGRTGRYLELPAGIPHTNVKSMAREGLRYELNAVLRQLSESNPEVTRRELRVKTNSDYEPVNMTARLLDEPEEYKGMIMILLGEEALGEARGEAEDLQGDQEVGRRIGELESELQRVQHDYRTAMEELETSNEELKSANEEIQSTNEELQSTNEELESSREELQSLNEELNTVNSQLHAKIEEIGEAYNTVADVLESTGIAILFLGNDLTIKRFTRQATKLVKLIDTDIGRPIGDIVTFLDAPHLLEEQACSVINDLSHREEEIRTVDGRCYLMKILPYRSRENRIEGVIVTFINIDKQKEAQQKAEELNRKMLEEARRFAENIIDTVRESFLVLDSELRVVSANRSFYETFGLSSPETEGRFIYDVGEGQWNVPVLRDLLGKIISKGESFENFVLEHHFAKIGRKRMIVNARELKVGAKEDKKILVAMEESKGVGETSA